MAGSSKGRVRGVSGLCQGRVKDQSRACRMSGLTYHSKIRSRIFKKQSHIYMDIAKWNEAYAILDQKILREQREIRLSRPLDPFIHRATASV